MKTKRKEKKEKEQQQQQQQQQKQQCLKSCWLATILTTKQPRQ